jgi:hypothetical protein
MFIVLALRADVNAFPSVHGAVTSYIKPHSHQLVLVSPLPSFRTPDNLSVYLDTRMDLYSSFPQFYSSSCLPCLPVRTANLPLFCCNLSHRASVRIAFQSYADCLLGSFLHLSRWLASARLLLVPVTLPRLKLRREQPVQKVVTACYLLFFFWLITTFPMKRMLFPAVARGGPLKVKVESSSKSKALPRLFNLTKAYRSRRGLTSRTSLLMP